MAQSKRATVYFDPRLYKELRRRAAQTDRTVSDLVNQAVRTSLAEDAQDLAAFEERKRETSLAFEKVIADFKRRRKL